MFGPPPQYLRTTARTAARIAANTHRKSTYAYRMSTFAPTVQSTESRIEARIMTRQPTGPPSGRISVFPMRMTADTQPVGSYAPVVRPVLRRVRGLCRKPGPGPAFARGQTGKAL